MKNKKTSFLPAGLFLIGLSSFFQHTLAKSTALIAASTSTGTPIPQSKTKIDLESFDLPPLIGLSYPINSSVSIDLNFNISTAKNISYNPVSLEPFRNKNQQISLGISHFL